MTQSQYGPVGVASPSYTWGRGYRDVVYIPDPSAGQAVKHTVPSSRIEQLVMVTATITTSAVVANRYLTLDILSGDGLLLGRFPSRTAVAAGASGLVTWALGPNVQAGAGGAAECVPLPDCLVDPGWSWQVSAVGIDPGDQLAGCRALVNAIPTGPTGPPMGTAALTDTDGPYGASVDVDIAVAG